MRTKKKLSFNKYFKKSIKQKLLDRPLFCILYLLSKIHYIIQQFIYNYL